jgi:hypothetical protein
VSDDPEPDGARNVFVWMEGGTCSMRLTDGRQRTYANVQRMPSARSSQNLPGRPPQT